MSAVDDENENESENNNQERNELRFAIDFDVPTTDNVWVDSGHVMSLLSVWSILQDSQTYINVRLYCTQYRKSNQYCTARTQAFRAYGTSIQYHECSI